MNDVGKRRRQLHAVLEEWAGACEWPGCEHRGPYEMAHVHGVGMGGRPSADTLENVALLCRFHHDLLDGRTTRELRVEMAFLLAGYLAEGWRRSIDW